MKAKKISKSASGDALRRRKAEREAAKAIPATAPVFDRAPEEYLPLTLTFFEGDRVVDIYSPTTEEEWQIEADDELLDELKRRTKGRKTVPIPKSLCDKLADMALE